MKIHKNINDAKEACNRYLIKLDELQEGEGVSEECEDSCCGILISASYYDEKESTLKTYFHN